MSKKTPKKFLRRIYYYSYQEGAAWPFYYTLNIHNPKVNPKTDIWEIIHEDFEEPAITVDEVNRWFTKSFFELTLNETELFTKKLNILRVTQPIYTMPVYEPMRQVIHLYQKLWDSLPDTINFLDEKATIFNDNIDQMKDIVFLSTHCKTILQLINSLKQNAYLIDELSLKYQSAANFWHVDTVFIAQEILHFAEARNLKLSIKQVNSKLILLIHYILKRVGIRSVSQSAVVQALNRFKSEKEYKRMIKYAPD
ncbi:hypothetical protein [Commensalibacter communis]|uniref:hypothetical protein n=1 Tax=Commensalibacter communis TaxID=2972786 RepID=UPI0022FF82DF|nr:hypothetical protein [Commensalibacter communis]CAI3949799.1 unnamed protein product [Commensalibacter communis]CAI3956716.1 unnamed protein product [Commensalibacter communis]